MKSSDLNLEPGVTFDWDIDEILTRQSCDVRGYSAQICTKCGATNYDEWGWYRGDEYLDHRDGNLGHSCYDHAEDAPIRDAWDACLEAKRRDDHYPDIVDSIRAFGFIRPLTARLVDSSLEFGDGHHRLAAAIELGLTTVPVKVFRDWAVAKDSGSWYTEDPIPTESEVVYR